MLLGMDLDEEIIVASSSRSRNDQFHNPLIEETHDIFDDMLLYDLGDNENNELIDDLEGYRDDDNELIDDREVDEELDENVESENEYEEVFEENNLFITPELEEENENYEEIELEDKIDIEILIWLFKFQQ